MKELKDEVSALLNKYKTSGVYLDSDLTSDIEKLCDAEMIGFAEWVATGHWDKIGEYWYKREQFVGTTSAELLTLYKNKG